MQDNLKKKRDKDGRSGRSCCGGTAGGDDSTRVQEGGSASSSGLVKPPEAFRKRAAEYEGDQADASAPSSALPPRDSKKRSAEDEGSQDIVRPAFVSDGVPARLGAKKWQADDEGDQDEHKIQKADTPMEALGEVESKVRCVKTLEGDLPMIICED